MKRLPSKFIVVSAHYVYKKKWTVSVYKINKRRNGVRCWRFVSICRLCSTLHDAKKYGLLLAQHYRIGYIQNVKHGEKYVAKHRASMILYDRDVTIKLNPGGKI